MAYVSCAAKVSILAIALTGCQMTPEQAQAWSQALSQMGNHMQQQSQYNYQQSSYYQQQSDRQFDEMREKERQREIMQEIERLRQEQRMNCDGYINPQAGVAGDC